MVKSKTSHPFEGNELNILTDSEKGQTCKPKKYRGNNPKSKPSLDTKADTDFQGWCTDFEGYIFDLGPRVTEKFD